jgi:hypothetical protein
MPIKLQAKQYHHRTAIWYTLYTRSEKWKNKKAQLFRLRHNKCEICGKHGDIAHHLTYERVTNEPFTDLQLVCRECHILIPHDGFRVPFIWLIYDESHINLKRVSWYKPGV